MVDPHFSDDLCSCPKCRKQERLPATLPWGPAYMGNAQELPRLEFFDIEGRRFALGRRYDKKWCLSEGSRILTVLTDEGLLKLTDELRPRVFARRQEDR